MTKEFLPTQDNSSRQEALQEAFLQFNQFSSTLSEAYAALEACFELLTQELADARSHKLLELDAKEKVTDRLQNLLRVLPGAIVVLDGEGVIQQTNPAAEQLFEQNISGKSWRDIVAHAFQPQWDDGHDVTLKNGRCVNISTQPLGAEPGQILLITDVSETRQLQDQIAGLKRVSAMGEMAAAMAHQIRTPLASAILYVSNLGTKKLSEGHREKFLKKAMSSLQHLESLVDDMLLFSRGGRFNTAPVSISQVLDEFVKNQLANNVPITLEQKVNTNCSVALCLDAFTSAIQNLINNALDAAEDRLEISILLEQVDNKTIQISIHDNGSGIPEDIKSRLFEPFVTSRSNGTGLGLAVVNSVIRAHNGKIQLCEKNSIGSCFIITLPINEKHETNIEKNERSAI
ncbi:MAG: ATP-binding protein [Pseudomonadota bacterium]